MEMKSKENYFRGIIPPPVTFIVLILIAFIAQRLHPINLIFDNFLIRFTIGTPILLISGVIAANALLIMRKHKTAFNFHNLTTKFIIEGSFRYTRNPLYLSLLLVMGSAILFSNSAWYFVSLILLFTFLNFGVVAREEKYLKEMFREEYTNYQKRVRRWI